MRFFVFVCGLMNNCFVCSSFSWRNVSKFRHGLCWPQILVFAQFTTFCLFLACNFVDGSKGAEVDQGPHRSNHKHIRYRSSEPITTHFELDEPCEIYFEVGFDLESTSMLLTECIFTLTLGTLCFFRSQLRSGLQKHFQSRTNFKLKTYIDSFSTVYARESLQLL